ncbi:dynein regulatory complex protein 9 [Aricia agestis]|uniref:dynein regulatory complex protein 9 n=1 Tax=Aricia agestis TaxID=91739 RepID=UPI001C208210|nr:dynein regulatory complex protein 9 [Aricia agestis]
MEWRQENNKLSWFQASLFAKILEDPLKEINILGECNNGLRVAKALSDMPVLLAAKYKVGTSETNELPRDNVNLQNLDYSTYKIKKLEADRKYFTDTIMACYLHLNLKQDFTVLLEEIQKYIQLNQDRIDLFDENAKNKLLRRDLYRQIRHQRNHIKTFAYDTNNVIENLKRKVQDYSLMTEIQLRYVEKWQQARIEQNDRTIELAESDPAGVIEYYKQRYEQDQRVHAEIELLMNILINETSQKVEEWMNKYDKDIEDVDLKIQYKKNDYQNIHEKRIGLEQTLENRKFLTKEWIEFKKERERHREYVEKMNQSAVIVQAWWRGLLVRQQLGPYKVNKKKGKKKKK